MQQIDGPPPNLWQSRGRWRGVGSKGWVPRNTVQRIGAAVIGTVFVVGALAMIVLSPAIKGDMQRWFPSPPVAWVASLLVVTWALAVAFFVIWLGGRLLTGCFRRSTARKGGAQ
jgi:hypothetical protein